MSTFPKISHTQQKLQIHFHSWGNKAEALYGFSCAFKAFSKTIGNSGFGIWSGFPYFQIETYPNSDGRIRELFRKATKTAGEVALESVTGRKAEFDPLQLFKRRQMIGASSH
jgi:hypothetical protein